MDINKIEQKRKYYLTLLIIAYVMLPVNFFLFIAFLVVFLVTNVKNIFLLLMILALVFAIFGLILSIVPILIYRKLFFTTYFNEYKYYDDFIFKYNKSLNIPYYNNEKIFTKYSFCSEGMYMSGSYLGINFESSYYENTSLRLKKGRLIKFEKDSLYDIIIENNKVKTRLNLKKYYEYKTESIYISDSYNIYTKNELDAPKIISPSFIQGIVKFNEIYDANLSFVIKDKVTYILINDYKTLFKHDIFTKVTKDLIDKFTLEIEIVGRLIKSLDLSRIFI